MTLSWPNCERTRLEALVGNRRQLASVRQVELRDGAERGVRALVFSTGGGLDFWVLQERSFDIGLLSWRGLPVAWQHPDGFSDPALRSPYSDAGSGIQRAMGGFLVTCGLDNVRQPRAGHPLHGSLPFTPGRLITCTEDWSLPSPSLVAEGEIVSAHLGKTCFRMRRRIAAPIAGSSLIISDWVENIGPAEAELMILYHMNFGFPVIASGTQVALNKNPVPFKAPSASPVSSQDLEPDCRKSGGEGGRFEVELGRDPSGPWPGINIAISGDAASLPFLQFWRDPRPRRNVLAIEPANCDRNADGTSGPGMKLAPGSVWSTRLQIDFSGPTEGSLADKGTLNGNGIA
ncbi:DUF4432 family protein [Roseibium sp. SCP14]|uniref:DUF4432 family protein n=1 Tax=Roseibium sp. SCP14 TaxID=3141375 RepID=UPI003338F5D9